MASHQIDTKLLESIYLFSEHFGKHLDRTRQDFVPIKTLYGLIIYGLEFNMVGMSE